MRCGRHVRTATGTGLERGRTDARTGSAAAAADRLCPRSDQLKGAIPVMIPVAFDHTDHGAQPAICLPDSRLDEVLAVWERYQRGEITDLHLRMQLRWLFARLTDVYPGVDVERDGIDVLAARITEWRWMRLLRTPHVAPERIWMTLAEQFRAGAGTVSIQAPGISLEVPFSSLHIRPADGTIAFGTVGWNEVQITPLVSVRLTVRHLPGEPTIPHLILGVACTREDGARVTFWRR